MDKEGQDILNKALQLFFKYGVRSISMDDIANQLGISKKTLYNHFENKADLIEKIMLAHINGEQDMCEGLINKKSNAIDQLAEIYQFNLSNHGAINPTLIFELKKYYGKVWQHFEDHKHNYIQESVFKNIEYGQEQGLYRKDLNAQIISRIYTNRIDMIIDGDVFPRTEFSFKDVMKELFIYHIRGIATPAGIAHLETTQPIF